MVSLLRIRFGDGRVVVSVIFRYLSVDRDMSEEYRLTGVVILGITRIVRAGN